MKYPEVLEDGSLQFDPAHPYPKSLPLFTVDSEKPYRFHPDFCKCVHRGLADKPMSDNPGCKRKRQVWHCKLLNIDVFPLQCRDCKEDKGAN